MIGKRLEVMLMNEKKLEITISESEPDGVQESSLFLTMAGTSNRTGGSVNKHELVSEVFEAIYDFLMLEMVKRGI